MTVDGELADCAKARVAKSEMNSRMLADLRTEGLLWSAIGRAKLFIVRDAEGGIAEMPPAEEGAVEVRRADPSEAKASSG